LVAGDAGVFVSLDGGNTYERFRDGNGPEMLPVQLLAFHPLENVRVLAGSAHNGLFLTDGSHVLASREPIPAK